MSSSPTTRLSRSPDGCNNCVKQSSSSLHKESRERERIVYLAHGTIVLAVEVVELERGRMMQLGTGPPRRQTLQERIVDGKVGVVLVQEPDGSPLYRYLHKNPKWQLNIQR